MNKKAKLKKIANEILKCRVCRQGKSGKMVFGEGNPNKVIDQNGESCPF